MWSGISCPFRPMDELLFQVRFPAVPPPMARKARNDSERSFSSGILGYLVNSTESNVHSEQIINLRLKPNLWHLQIPFMDGFQRIHSLFRIWRPQMQGATAVDHHMAPRRSKASRLQMTATWQSSFADFPWDDLRRLETTWDDLRRLETVWFCKKVLDSSSETGSGSCLE